MNKLIILPNLKLIPKGMVLYLNKELLKYSLCDILLLNKIYIPHFCEKFGKCKTCKVILLEGFKSVNNIDYEESEILGDNIFFIYRLSCQVYIKKNSNLIININ